MGLGANIGDGEATIHRAFELLQPELRDSRLSPVIRSKPMYVEDQPTFWNAVAVGEANVGPIELLGKCRQIEDCLGRVRRQRNGPREIDVDLLAYGCLVLRSSAGFDLELPHPRIFEREFVLKPMLELDPNASLPQFGCVSDMLRKLCSIG